MAQIPAAVEEKTGTVTRKKKDPKVQVPKEPKIPKEPKVLKEPKPKREAIEMKTVALPAGVILKNTKYVTVFINTDKTKKAWIRGGSIGVTEHIAIAGFKKVSKEDAKKNHLGKTKMVGHINSKEELEETLKALFA